MHNAVENRFSPDEYTVVLYHFDEGRGDVAYDACGDKALTLHARRALWGQGPAGKPVARFTRSEDDANLFIGPINNDKLQLRTCTEGWTIEAWVRYTGEVGQELGKTYANICSTDDEGFTQPRGPRGGWLFALHTAQQRDGLRPWGRFVGKVGRADSSVMTGSDITPITEGYEGEGPIAIDDKQWHHVAWQFRFCDQQHSLFIDGRLVWLFNRPSGREVINDIVDNASIPFTVGGLLHQLDPPYYPGHGNWEGEICELRISNVLRYKTTESLSILKKLPPPVACYMPYEFSLEVEAVKGKVTWKISKGSLPPGLSLDANTGIIHGTPTAPVLPTACTICVTDEAGNCDEQVITLETKLGEITTDSLPIVFAGKAYAHQLEANYLAVPLKWSIADGELPDGISLSNIGLISGKATKVDCSKFTVKVVDSLEQVVTRELTLKVTPACIEEFVPDENTVVLYDWQGPDGKFIPDVMGDKELELTWTNMMGDIRVAGRQGRKYPITPGGGEWGFVGPQENDKLNLRTCDKAWTVEAWVRRCGSVNHYGQPFDFGHICGTYDNTHKGTWELYLAYDGCSDGGMSPGVCFFGEKPENALVDLHPWKRRKGIVADKEYLSINDTQWHHVAWQYDYETDTHELFLDGVLIWQMTSPDGRKLVNDRMHDAQFSVGTRLNGYAKYGGDFNWLGWGNFFGQIGEIRISNIRRY